MIVNRRRFISAAPALILAPSLLLPRESKAALTMHSSAPASINGLKINLIFNSSVVNWNTAPAYYQTSFVTAANMLMAAFPNTNVTINIDVEYTTIQGAPAGSIAPSTSGAIDTGFVLSVPYSNIRAALAAIPSPGADLTALLGTLPGGSSFGGQSNFFMSSANSKVLSLFGFSGGPISATDPATDGWVGIGSGWSSAKTDGVALHEVSHCLGRIVRKAPFEFSRYTAVNTPDFNSGAANAYFSLDSGNTSITIYDTHGSDPSDFDNSVTDPGSGLTDAFDAQQVNPLQTLSPLDLRLLGVMGYR